MLGIHVYRAAALATLSILSAALGSGCQSLPDYRPLYAQGDCAGAEAALDAQIIDGLDLPEGQTTLEPHVVPVSALDDSTMALLFMDKAMLRLAQGHSKGSLRWMDPARAAMDEAYVDSFTEYLGNPFDLLELLMGDAQRDYQGADYEHVVLRAMLSLCDLLCQQVDAYAYSQESADRQREILASELGEDTGFKPRENYRRIALGSYLRGVIDESKLFTSEARLSYEEAASFLPESAILTDAVERTTSGSYTPEPGQGVVHVFYLGGRGPHLEEGLLRPDLIALQLLIEVGIAIFSEGAVVSPLTQDLIPVPAVAVNTPEVPPLRVWEDGTGAEVTTETLLDVNQVAQEQLDANMPMILTRALLRRAIKGWLAAEVESRYGKLAGLATSAALTVIEQPDTRSWLTLPAQFQVSRMVLPEGRHTLHFSGAADRAVNVGAGKDTYVVVHHPFLDRPGTVLVDVFSDEYLSFDAN